MCTVVLPSLLFLAALEPEGLGVVWRRSKATAVAIDRQRIVEDVIADLGWDPAEVISDAVAEARRQIARRIDRGPVDAYIRIRSELDDTRERFRRGSDPREVVARLDEISDEVRTIPQVSGVASLMRDVHLSRARAAWNLEDGSIAAEAMTRAIALDPTADLPTRIFPPDFIAAYASRRDAVSSSSRTWWFPRVDLGEDSGIEVEIDGRVGLRGVPPGEHVIVLRRAGADPVARWVASTDDPSLSVGEPILAAGSPTSLTAAELVCTSLELRRWVEIEVRGSLWGLRGYVCGAGFTPRQIRSRDELRAGMALVLEQDAEVDGGPTLDDPWPPPPVLAPRPKPVASPERAVVADAPKPWFKRVWIWTLVGGVVVAGVVAAAVVATRPGSRYVVDVPGDFIED